MAFGYTSCSFLKMSCGGVGERAAVTATALLVAAFDRYWRVCESLLQP
jgi:hypothetical protein